MSIGVNAASVSFEKVSKLFGGNITAVRDVSFRVEPGELVTLLGPSGCGKTTTLRMIAGLEMASSGRILIGERDVTPSPQQRLRLEQGDAPSAERSGHFGALALRSRKPKQSARGAGREVEPLPRVLLERLKAQLEVEPALEELFEDSTDRDVDPLEERNGLAKPTVQLERSALRETGSQT